MAESPSVTPAPPTNVSGLVTVKDGGLSHANHHLWSRSPNPDKAFGGEAHDIESLRRALNKAYDMAEKEELNFIPLDKITSIINPASIRRLLEQLFRNPTMSGLEIEKLKSKICGNQSSANGTCCLRLVAILILRGKERHIPSIVDTLGLTDQCLYGLINPSSTSTTAPGDLKHLYKIFEAESGWTKRELRNQAAFLNAPFFTRPAHGVHHYVLSDETPLPFIEQKPITRDKEGGGFSTGEGGFGVVRCIKIHPSHYHFPDHRTSVRDGIFAVKKLTNPDREEFDREISALLKFSHENNKQLVKLLATFEIKKKSFSEYHLIFPYADGSVTTLWKRNPTPDKEGRFNSGWILTQALAIAMSLRYIHEEYAKFEEKRAKDAGIMEPEAWGRHGDIKAGNFLVYDEANNPVIVLADFGLARFHRLKTRSMARARIASPSYRPPEFDSGTLSRKSDIWCLGTFFLEFLTWHLMGWYAVDKKFPNSREEIDHQRVVSDIFFAKDKKTGRFIVKPKVTSWIKRLHQHHEATEFVHAALDLIENDMLVAEPKDRIDAKKLVEKLKEMNEKSGENSEYLKRRCPYPRGREVVR